MKRIDELVAGLIWTLEFGTAWQKAATAAALALFGMALGYLLPIDLFRRRRNRRA